MRTLLLSVCVGLALLGCEGGGGTDNPDGREDGAVPEAGAEESDAAARPERDAASVGNERDAAGTGASDAGARDAAALDSGSQDAGGRDGGGADASARDGGQGQTDGGSDAAAASGRPVFVVAGYRSGIAFSTDLGLTWKTVHGPTGPFADNEYVLSGAAFGKGTFVVAGFEIFTSSDGEQWTKRMSAGSEWLGSLNFGAGVFAGAGGSGFTQWSEDGVSWHAGTSLGGEASDTSAFGNGTFMAATRDGRWWRSMNGKMWTQDSMGHGEKIVWCGDRFADQEACSMTVASNQVAQGEGVWIRVENNMQIRRSTNGQSWTNGGRVDFEANAVAFGYVK